LHRRNFTPAIFNKISGGNVNTPGMKGKKILISQPPPAENEKNPYSELIAKYNVEITFKKFFKVVPLTSLEFRQKNKCKINDFDAVVFTSKNVVDFYFQMLKDLRIEIKDNMKYFCSSEKIAVYLQKYIPFRKRKILYGNTSLNDLEPIFKKEENIKLKYLVPTSDSSYDFSANVLKINNLNYQKLIIFKNEYEDLSTLPIQEYSILCFFSPHGIKSLFHNFPDYQQNDQIVLVYGNSTAEEAQNYNLKIAQVVPNKESPSIVDALDKQLALLNKKKKEK